MKESRFIVTISGQDKIGIVSEFTQVLATYKVNIEDIKQTIMKDQFVMFLLGDLSRSENSFHEVKEGLIKKGQELEMEVLVQKKTIFDKMHTI